MEAYLVDGTYELFRHFYALPSYLNKEGEEVAAIRGVVGSVIQMLESGIDLIGVATDHVIESFRNGMWPGYKTSEGVEKRLLDQFWPLEDALIAMGVKVWPMIELEADDALAGAARSLAEFPELDRIFICSPDKDLAQSVRDDRIVQLDRRTRQVRDEQGVWKRFGVSPKSIPDYLGLVGDAADGYPGLPGWGAKSASTLLSAYSHIEEIPLSSSDWKVTVRGADRLAAVLRENFKLALLFRDLATVRTSEPRISSLEEIKWSRPASDFDAWCSRLETPEFLERIGKIAQTSDKS